MIKINKEALKKTEFYRWYDSFRDLLRSFYYRIMPCKYIISNRFRLIFGRDLNWENPIDLNEKINWLKLYSDTQIWTELSDKYKVRDYIKSKGLEDILVPLYAKWDTPEDVDFSILPDSFVIKANHGSGDAIIVKDKTMVDEVEVKKAMGKAISQKFGYREGEPHYLKIKPCIIAEKLLEQNNDAWTTSIVDYKIWCFSGKPAYIWACYSRSKEGVYVETHDLNWGYHPEKSVFTHHYKDGKGIVPKPKCLKKMIDVATILSSGFPQVRVDLYEIDGKVYFGELTFTSNGGYNDFYTQDFLNELGELVILK